MQLTSVFLSMVLLVAATFMLPQVGLLPQHPTILTGSIDMVEMEV